MLIKKIRYRCPFYGFHFGGIPTLFFDSNGNQCALIMDSYAPCKMELKDETPNWYECSFNNEKAQDTIEELKEVAIFFPYELWPENEGKWDGISFDEWMEHVMELDQKLIIEED